MDIKKATKQLTPSLSWHFSARRSVTCCWSATIVALRSWFGWEWGRRWRGKGAHAMHPAATESTNVESRDTNNGKQMEPGLMNRLDLDQNSYRGYIYIYIYICTHICSHIYIYILVCSCAYTCTKQKNFWC